jgi:hypothetical protein
MLRAVILVLVLLLVIAYLSLFLAWNAKLFPVVTWQLGAQYSQDLPVGLLFILGLVVGAVAMALALTGPWNALKDGEAQARLLVERAKAKLKSQEEKIRKMTAQLEAAAAEPTEGAPEAEEKGEATEAAKPAEEDPEVV